MYTKYGFCRNISEFTYFMWTIPSFPEWCFDKLWVKLFTIKINFLLWFPILCQHIINYIEQFAGILLSQHKLLVLRIVVLLVGGLYVDVDRQVEVVHSHSGGAIISCILAVRIIFFAGRTFINIIFTTLISFSWFPKTYYFMFETKSFQSMESISLWYNKESDIAKDFLFYV